MDITVILQSAFLCLRQNVVCVIKYTLFQIAGYEINLRDFHVDFEKTVHMQYCKFFLPARNILCKTEQNGLKQIQHLTIFSTEY